MDTSLFLVDTSFENQCEQIRWFSFCQSYIKLVTGGNSFSVDTDIQKQCTLINVKIFNNQCTPVDFQCTLTPHKAYDSWKFFFSGNNFFQCK